MLLTARLSRGERFLASNVQWFVLLHELRVCDGWAIICLSAALLATK
jgi:hypothetical protein